MVFFLNVLVLQDSNIDDPKREVDSSMLQVRQTTLYLLQKALTDRQKPTIRRKLEELDYTCGQDSRQRYQFAAILLSYENF